ncbi:unnamed protein product, partial [Effrenium voratum]
MREIANSEARKCVVHERNCPLPRSIDAFGSGFSCTSFSSLNGESQLNTAAVAEQKGVASVETFSGCVQLIGAGAPKFFILENVPRIDAAADS